MWGRPPSAVPSSAARRGVSFTKRSCRNTRTVCEISLGEMLLYLRENCRRDIYLTALELRGIAGISAASAGPVRSCGFLILGHAKGPKSFNTEGTEDTEENREGHDFSRAAKQHQCPRLQPLRDCRRRRCSCAADTPVRCFCSWCCSWCHRNSSIKSVIPEIKSCHSERSEEPAFRRRPPRPVGVARKAPFARNGKVRRHQHEPRMSRLRPLRQCRRRRCVCERCSCRADTPVRYPRKIVPARWLLI
jgi:hypothetical protein